MEQNYGYGQKQNLWDRTWKDKRGRVVMWQTPNAFLYAWLVLTMFSLFVSGKLADGFAIAGEIALIIWSLLEILKGVNYFRRAIGLLILFFAIISLIKSI